MEEDKTNIIEEVMDNFWRTADLSTDCEDLLKDVVSATNNEYTINFNNK